MIMLQASKTQQSIKSYSVAAPVAPNSIDAMNSTLLDPMSSKIVGLTVQVLHLIICALFIEVVALKFSFICCLDKREIPQFDQNSSREQPACIEV